jgi:predicted aspartyl protease
MHILNRNNIYGLVSDKIHSDLSDSVISTSILTSYIPIPPNEVTNFAMTLTKEIKEAFNNASVFKTDVYYVTISKKRTKVYTWVDLEPEVPHPFEKIGEIVLELPLLEWETLFNILEEIKDFFQENLC